MAERDELILANIIANRVETQPDLDVVTFVHIDERGEICGETRTYRQLWESGQRIAGALDAAGVKQGQAFAIVMQNHPEFVEAMIGASITDTVFVPIDPRTRGQKLAFMLDFPDCVGAIVADYALADFEAVRSSLGKLKWVWVLKTGEGTGKSSGPNDRMLDDILSGPVPQIEIRATDPDAPMQMLFTSGTTGDPKAILAPHRRFGEAAMIGYVLGLQPSDRPYMGLSLTHANAQLVTLASSIKMGLRGVISRKFTKSRLWDITRAYGCTVFNLLGGMTTAIYSEPRKPNDADNPVRYVISAGMPAAIWEDFRKRFNVEIFEFYGAAEGGLCINPPGVGPVGSVGKPPPTMELKIFDEQGNECPPGVAGEICFHPTDGTDAKVRYFKNEKASQEKAAGGWLRMGDIGHVDENGWLFFHYRKGGGLRRNGDFINPGFVEKAIAECDGVNDVFVYGIPAASGAPGEVDVVAAIVPADAETFDPEAVYRECREKLEANSVPSYLQIVDEIPKTASEKPQERFLRDMFAPTAPNVVSADKPHHRHAGTKK